MAYEYITRIYGVTPVVGARVTTKDGTKRSWVIAREDPSHGHYVQVKFDGGPRHALPCHPLELEFLPS